MNGRKRQTKTGAVTGPVTRWRTKPKLNWNPLVRIDQSFKLPGDAREELVEIADPRRHHRASMVSEVQKLLSAYPSLTHALDDAPRPVHKRAFLEPLVEKARGLIQGLEALRGDAARSQGVGLHLRQIGYDLERLGSLVFYLNSFALAGEALCEELYKGVESRRARTRRGRDFLVESLCHLFDFYHSSRRDHAKLKAEFVAAALSAGDVPRGKFALSKGRAPQRSGSRLVQTVAKLGPPCEKCLAAGRTARSSWAEWMQGGAHRGDPGPYFLA